MKNNAGVTFIELMVVMAIISILAAFSIIKYQKLVANNELQRVATNLYMELSSLRPLALKYDSKVMVQFTAAQCSIYVDTSGNGVREPAELKKAYKILPATVSLGIAASGPSGAPTGIAWDASGIAGNWKATVMTVDNNSLGSINSGAIYIRSSRLPRITYCIGIAAGFQSLKLLKWGGSSWYAF